MARTNAFLTAGNDNGRRISMGGRKSQSSVWARLNTDNASHSDCSICVSAEVVGQRSLNGKPRKTCHNCGRKWVEGTYEGGYTPNEDDLRECPGCGADRQGIDTRKSCFRVELPDQNDEFCEVEIVEHGYALKQLARMGAALAAIKGIVQIVDGENTNDEDKIELGKKTLETAGEIVAELESHIKLPNVTLPGGYSLKHALACIEFVQRFQNQQITSEN